jgi:hypothetical protein
MFFRYRKLSQEEIRQLTDHSDNTKRESKAGSIGDKTSEPADKLRADTTSGSSLGVMLHG